MSKPKPISPQVPCPVCIKGVVSNNYKMDGGGPKSAPWLYRTWWTISNISCSNCKVLFSELPKDKTYAQTQETS